ncbi:unnamed protein product [Cunninghamella echinulata]
MEIPTSQTSYESINQEKTNHTKEEYSFYAFDLNVVEEVLQNPHDPEYTDHFGFKIQVKTDNEYEDDTSMDSENEDNNIKTDNNNNNKTRQYPFSSEDDDDTDIDTAITTPTTIKHSHLSVSSLDSEEIISEQRQSLPPPVITHNNNNNNNNALSLLQEQLSPLPNSLQQQRRQRSMTISHQAFPSTSSKIISSAIKPSRRQRAMTLISPQSFTNLIHDDEDNVNNVNNSNNNDDHSYKNDMCNLNTIPDKFCSTIMRQKQTNSDKSPIEKPSNVYTNRQSKRISGFHTRNSLSSSIDSSSSSSSAAYNTTTITNGIKNNFYDKLTQSLRKNGKQSSMEDSTTQTILKEETSQNLAHLKEISTDNYDWEFWATVINDFDTIKQHKRDVLREHISHGIPNSLRGMLWQIFSKSRHNSEAVELEYRELLKRTSPQEKIIRRDIPRAFPNQPFFKHRDGDGQEMLFNVIKAYSLFDPEVGYCQGLPFVVGCLLLNMPDEAAFCVLINLMIEYGLRGHFTPNMELLHERLYQFDELLRIHLPQIYRHLEAQKIHSTMYASQWFMTLFAYRCPLDLVFRVIDMVFADGSAIVLNVGLALMKKNQPTILSLEFEGLLAFLGSEIFDVYKNDASSFVKDTYEFSISPRELAKLSKQHFVKASRNAKIQSKEDHLRQENHELTQRARKLEKSYKALEKEHEELAIKVIASKMERASVSDENEQLQHSITQLEQLIQKTKQKMENEKQDEFDRLAQENNQLVERNAQLEDHLAEIESTLIDFKLKYACSENEYEQMKNKLGQIKKISG